MVYICSVKFIEILPERPSSRKGKSPNTTVNAAYSSFKRFVYDGSNKSKGTKQEFTKRVNNTVNQSQMKNNAQPVEKLKGEFVTRKEGSKKVYRVIGYCRLNKKYQLDDEEDISRAMYVKKGTLLFIAEDY